ncbi:MAG TPA: hypothetical protein VF043_29795 [Ktedonobacteraceae bacterium]
MIEGEAKLISRKQTGTSKKDDSTAKKQPKRRHASPPLGTDGDAAWSPAQWIDHH